MLTIPSLRRNNGVNRTITNELLLVWDNFESISGAAEGESHGGLLAEDLQTLKRFLEELRGGKTRVLITSRSDEAWLGTTACFRVPLGGLHGEERQELAKAILDDLGIVLNPKDQATADLIDSLEGHPLMMRAVLPALARQSAANLSKAIDSYVPQANSTDPVERKLYATLRFVEDGLPENLRPLLYPIGLHARFVDADYLADMAQVAQQDFSPPQIHLALGTLQVAGLVQAAGKNIFRLHPALNRFLRARADQFCATEETATAWKRAFVVAFRTLADHVAPKEFHEQRGFLAVHESDVAQARELARGVDGFELFGALTQAMAVFALNQHQLEQAGALCKELAQHCERHGRELHAAGAYHQLGKVAHKGRDLPEAEAWYRKALEIAERLGHKQGAASTYHQLGMVAENRREMPAAEAWYRKALEVYKSLGDKQGEAMTYNQLGLVAQLRGDLSAAEATYLKSLEIKEQLGNKLGAAVTYHQLGRVAQLHKDLPTAEAWYLKSLEIKEQLGDKQGLALTHHQLGMVAQERKDLAAAEDWYIQALVIKEHLRDAHGAASTYHQLGLVAHMRRDLPAAEAWYLKSLKIKEQLGDEYGAASTYHQLGLVAHLRRDLPTAEAWYLKSLGISERLCIKHYAEITRYALIETLDQLKSQSSTKDMNNAPEVATEDGNEIVVTTGMVSQKPITGHQLAQLRNDLGHF